MYKKHVPRSMTIVSAFSWDTIVGCFSVLAVQLSWQLLIMLLIVWNRPGRSHFHNGILITQACNQLLIVVAQVVALDCFSNLPANVYFAEAVSIFTLCNYVVLAGAACAGIFFERGYRVRMQNEAQEAERKLREETLSLSSGDAESAKRRATVVLPNLRHHELRLIIASDATSLIVERQKRIADALADTTKQSGAAAEGRTAAGVDVVPGSLAHKLLWKSVEEISEVIIGEPLPRVEIPDGVPQRGNKEPDVPINAAQQIMSARCKRCLRRMPQGGPCSTCNGIELL